MIENNTLNLIVELSGVAKDGNIGDAGEIASAVLVAQLDDTLRCKSCQKHLENPNCVSMFPWDGYKYSIKKTSNVCMIPITILD